LGLVFLIPLLPQVQSLLWAVYQQLANVTSTPPPVTTAISPVSLAKIGVAGYVFLFGYHVYPLQLWLVIPGFGPGSEVPVGPGLYPGRRTVIRSDAPGPSMRLAPRWVAYLSSTIS
jgi:hypothetical protein